MSRWFTRTGDRGESGIFGYRFPKDHPIFEAFGAIDEVNAALGIARSFSTNAALTRLLITLQDQLFRVNADLAFPATRTKSLAPRITSGDTEWLEESIAKWSKPLPRLQHFVIPGGAKTSAFLYSASTIMRRAERAVVRMRNAKTRQKHSTNPALGPYLNRFSSLLFVLSLVVSRQGRKDFPHPRYRVPYENNQKK